MKNLNNRVVLSVCAKTISSHKFSRKWLLLSVFTVCIGIMLTGCGKKEKEAEPVIEYIEPVVEKLSDVNGTSEAAGTTQGVAGNESADGVSQDESGVDATQQEEPKRQVDLRGKKFAILGDSICSFVQWVPDGYNFYYPSKGGELTDVSQMWWSIFSEHTGMKLAKDGSSAGSMCVGDSTNGFDHQVGCNEFRTSDLQDQWGNFPHIIFVYLGTNDLLNHSPMGDNDGTKPVEEGMIENFSDAYTLMLDKVAANYPAAQLYCCTLLQVGEPQDNGKFAPFVNEVGLQSEDYSKKIEEIAAAKGWPVIDLYHCGIDMDNLGQYSIDGIHPNADGMRLLNDAIEDCVIENCRY